MVAITGQDKERVFFHLGMPSRAGVPAGDVAEVEQALNEIPSDYVKGQVLSTLDICDLLFEARNPINTQARFTLREIYAGDINRSVVRDIIDDIGDWERLYVKWTDELALQLSVPNYRNEGYQSLKFARTNESFVNTIPGPADTAIGSSKFELAQTGGGVGFIGYD